MTATQTKKYLKQHGIDIDAMLVRIGKRLRDTSNAFDGKGVPIHQIPVIAKMELERFVESIKTEGGDW